MNAHAQLKHKEGPAQLPKVPAVSGQSSNAEINPGSAGGEVGALEKSLPMSGAPVYA